MNDQGAQSLGSLLKKTETLSRVFLNSTRITEKQFVSIMEETFKNPSSISVKSGVQFVFDFGSNNLEMIAGKVLKNIVTHPVRCMEKLNFRQNNMRESGIGSLCKSLQQFRTLKYLNLDSNVKTSHFASCEELLGESLTSLCKSLPSLETLSINGTDDSA